MENFIEPIFLFIVFWATKLPLRDFDIWFHIKAGEYFANHGLSFIEHFSFAAAGRQWIAFEWLFQLISYELSRIGLWIIPPFIGLFIVAMSYIYLKTLKDVLGVPLVIRITTLLLFLVGGLEFFTARPHILAYTFLFLELLLILARMFKGNRLIRYLPILVLFWTNIHSTGFLSWGMLFTYAAIAAIQYFITKKERYLGIVKDFVITGFICAVITILPPKGLRDYQLLWEFFVNRKFLASFIAEWSPPFEDFFFGFLLYTFYLSVSTISVVWITIKEKKYVENLWTVPFLVIGFVGFSATRNIFLGLYSTTFLFAWALSRMLPYKPKRIKPFVWGSIFILIIASQIYLYVLKHNNITGERLYYPVQSAEFAKRYLHGRMFNEYSYGGYMLYAVYPQLQVFIDGRAETYLCCEMHDYLKLSENKLLPDPQYTQFLDTFWNAYKIDFVIISVQKHQVMRRIGSLLSRDPNWALVFWDDDSEVFVRKNGKNDAIIQKLETHAATPYLRDPFPKDKIDQAQFEYERMDAIAKSARTSNALGYIYAVESKFEDAKSRFADAIDRDPGFESPYMNLAELAVREGNIPAAIQLYEKALTLASDRGLIYIRLGQLTLQLSPDRKEDVRKLWEQGIKNTVDTDAKATLEKLLHTL